MTHQIQTGDIKPGSVFTSTFRGNFWVGIVLSDAVVEMMGAEEDGVLIVSARCLYIGSVLEPAFSPDDVLWTP